MQDSLCYCAAMDGTSLSLRAKKLILPARGPELLEPGELMPYTYDYARRLADTVSPGSLRETKRQIYTDLHRDVGAAVRDADALLERMMTEADYREAVSAFTEKRPPRWSGR